MTFSLPAKMSYCVLCGKKNVTGKNEGITFHAIPRKNKDELDERWVAVIRRECPTVHPNVNTRVCSQHFSRECLYVVPGKEGLRDKRKVHKEAVPRKDITALVRKESENQHRKSNLRKTHDFFLAATLNRILLKSLNFFLTKNEVSYCQSSGNQTHEILLSYNIKKKKQ